MGNQLSGTVPAMILPVERYLSLPELNDFDFLAGLGSTRFLKVAKAMLKSVSSDIRATRHYHGDHLANIEIFRDGTCVLKIFVVNDPSFSLIPYVNVIKSVANALPENSASNCLPYRKIILTDKVAVVARQFGKDTLYDRLSTRPFLQDVEKRWIAFQLLKALEQCHSANVCHGDIKSQNITITSWTWAFLVDFANFKPTFIPEDNPTDFSYFFDTSRRRTCYIAPERFGKYADLSGFTLLQDDVTKNQKLNHQMDIFSLGCVFIEIFTDGFSPFDFSQMLAYRERKYFPTKALDQIKDSQVREMIISMIQLDPSKRNAAVQYLSRYKSSVFPEQFYVFLFPYLKNFVQLPRICYEEKIEKLYSDRDMILKKLKLSDDQVLPYQTLIISLTTSLIRILAYTESKLKAMRMLKLMATCSKEPIILDRILPYILYMCKDGDPRVRAESISITNFLMGLVKDVPKSDFRIFVDYIFPVLSNLVNDPSNIVKSVLAENIASLAGTAARFLEYVNLNIEEDPQVQVGSESYSTLNYQSELRLLQEIVQEMVVTLLCDRDNNIKRTLVQSGLPSLCLFFGRQKASDILVSHLITFLNDKADWRLRSSFYECVPALATYVGWQSTLLLKPLLIQGFRDLEENVTFKTFCCLTYIASLGLLQKSTITELVKDATPFLAHPNLSLRIGATSFIATCAENMNLADVHCKILPLLLPYLKRSLMKITRKEVVLQSLKPNIPRSLWEDMKNSSLLTDLLNFLDEKSIMLQLSITKTESLPPDNGSLRTFYLRLKELGLNESNEQFVKNFASILRRMRKIKTDAKEKSPASKVFIVNGVLDLSEVKVRRKHADLTWDRQDKRLKYEINAANMNPEWKEMFGVDLECHTDDILPKDLASTPVDKTKNLLLLKNEKNLDDLSPSIAYVATEDALAPDASILPDEPILELKAATVGPIDTSIAAETNIRVARCRSDLSSLVDHKRAQWRYCSPLTDHFEQYPINWRPNGSLIANLLEHRGSVKRLSGHPSGKHFMSCSSDGTAKFWNTIKLEGRNMINKSTFTYSKCGGRLTSVSLMDRSFACCSDNGIMQVINLESDVSNPRIIFKVDLDMENDGYLLDIFSTDEGDGTTLIGLTHHGKVICYDLRCEKPAWVLRTSSEHGLPTGFCVDEQRKNWSCVGTDKGTMILWDIRFGLPISVWNHPAGRGIHRLFSHPSDTSKILATVSGAGEIAEWNLETCSRQSVIWPSCLPPLSYSSFNSESADNIKSTALLPYPHPEDSSSIMLISGDNRGNISNYDLYNIENSYTISSADDRKSHEQDFKMQVIDGITVFTRDQITKSIFAAKNRSSPDRSELNVTTYHHDSVTDLLACRTQAANTFMLISSSSDGVIKLWK